LQSFFAQNLHLLDVFQAVPVVESYFAPVEKEKREKKEDQLDKEEDTLEEETDEDDDEMFVCKLCEYSSLKYGALFNHCLKAHLRIHQYRCRLCQQGFKMLADIRRHYRSVRVQRV
jgi:hypothetical protein